MVNLSYSLGDAIDWKRHQIWTQYLLAPVLLLARGRDRLETFREIVGSRFYFCLLLARGRDRLESLGNFDVCVLFNCDNLLLARGRDRLETPFVKADT